MGVEKMNACEEAEENIRYLSEERKAISLTDRMRVTSLPSQKGRNCFGTAFYLAGFSERDAGIDTVFGKSFVEAHCLESSEPKHDTFIAFDWDTNLIHIAYLFEQFSTLFIVERGGWDGPFSCLTLDAFLHTNVCQSRYSDLKRATCFNLPEARYE